MMRSLSSAAGAAARYRIFRMALTGHTASQAPQSVHRSASITYTSATCAIASTGHSGWHAPHDMQSLVVSYAMIPSRRAASECSYS
jgi:hypothetical protein